MKVILAWALAAGLAAASGCARGPKAESEAAILQAVERHLASRSGLNPKNMTLRVGSVKFRQETAEAEVVFTAKNDPKAIMTMHYGLRRQGAGWVVEPQAPAGGGHGAAATGASELPVGHPPVSPATPPAGELPAGHPPVKSK